MLNFITSGFYPWAQIHFGFTNIWSLFGIFHAISWKCFPIFFIHPKNLFAKLCTEGIPSQLFTTIWGEVRCGYTLPRPRKKISGHETWHRNILLEKAMEKVQRKARSDRKDLGSECGSVVDP